MEEALKKIMPSYVRSYLYIDREGNEHVYDQVERVFAYELYHQIRNLTENKIIDGHKIVVNAEIPKQGYPGEETNHDTNKSNGTTSTLPDIVIHGGQSDSNPNMQLLVGEIKRNTTGYKDLKKDLRKLGWFVKCLYYENKSIPFKAGCFIMTNISKNDLYEKIKTVISNEPDCDIHFKGENNRDEKLSEVANKITIFSYKKNDDNSQKNEKKHRLLKNFCCRVYMMIY